MITFEMLQSFCGDWNNSKPWVTEDGKTWATNNSLAVIVDCVYGAGSEYYGEKQPDLKRIMSGLEEKTQALDLSSIVMPKAVKCHECNGHGEHECSCGHTHDCEKCEGLGEIKDSSVVVGGIRFRGTDIAAIQRLPGLKNLRIDPNKKCYPAIFDFDGGIGLIMVFHD